MNTLLRSIGKSALGLSAFAIITTGTIATTHIITKDRIAEEVRKAQVKALLEIVPAKLFDNDLLADTRVLDQAEALALPAGAMANIATYQGEVTAVVIPAIAPNGYSGSIRIISAIDTQGSLLGVRVVEHKETPGLGDKIEARKSDWIGSFAGKSLSNPLPEGWKVKKDGGEFDQMTGATITPRAVVSAVHRSLVYFSQHRDHFIKQPTGTNRETRGEP